jgi:hypothetical protein
MLNIRISQLPWEGETLTEVFVLDNENNLTLLTDDLMMQGNSFEIKGYIPAFTVKLIKLSPAKQ